jgi:hypothetical protein
MVFRFVVAFRGDAAKLGPDAAAAYRDWIAAGGTPAAEWREEERWGLIVDGLFGIGLTRRIEDPYAQWIVRANDAAIPILALDVPSGLDADTGVAQSVTIRATATATFIALKPGLLTADGPDHCGKISVHALDLDVASIVPARGERLTWQSLSRKLPPSRCADVRTFIRKLRHASRSSAATMAWLVLRFLPDARRFIWQARSGSASQQRRLRRLGTTRAHAAFAERP